MLASTGLLAAAVVSPAAASQPVEEPRCTDDVSRLIARSPEPLRAMAVQDLWAEGALGRGITVAVVHAGVDGGAPHLAGAAGARALVRPGRRRPDRPQHGGRRGHGARVGDRGTRGARLGGRGRGAAGHGAPGALVRLGRLRGAGRVQAVRRRRPAGRGDRVVGRQRRRRRRGAQRRDGARPGARGGRRPGAGGRRPGGGERGRQHRRRAAVAGRVPGRARRHRGVQRRRAGAGADPRRARGRRRTR